MKPLFLIIDGSSMLSTSYYALMPPEMKMQKSEEARMPFYPKLLQTQEGVFTNAVYGMSKTLVQLISDLEPAYIAVVFDKTRNTFRRKLYPEYKAQRSRTPQPLKNQFMLMETILSESGIKTLLHDDFEADDLAGSLVERFKEETKIRLLTKDRDYLQLVDNESDVACYILTEQEKADDFRSRYSLCEVERDKIPRALSNVMLFTDESVMGEKGVIPSMIPDLKGIEGDTSDNIPGVKGVLSAAAPLLMEYENLEGIYEEIDSCKTPKEEKEMVAFWKDLLGIKRSPLNQLKKFRDTAFLSRELATIRRDVPVPENINHFSVSNIRKDMFADWMEKLEIKNVRL